MRREIILPILAVLHSGICLLATWNPPAPPLLHHPQGPYICEDLHIRKEGHLRLELKDVQGTGLILYTRIPSGGPLTTGFLHCGDTLYLPGAQISEIQNFQEGFDYRSQMFRKGFFYQGHISCDRLIIKKAKHYPFVHLMSEKRRAFIRKIRKIFPEEEYSSVITALTTGDKRYISQELRESYARSGASHLLALSGLHIGILYRCLCWLSLLFRFLPGYDKIRSFIILLLLWLYTFFTGAGVSILRATLMVTLYETGTLLGREKNAIGALALSAMIILLQDPQSIHSLSFRLSYEAMLGILLIYPTLHAESMKFKIPRFFRKMLDTGLVSISCQIFTAPQLFYSFGSSSSCFLLTNTIAPLLMNIILCLIPVTIIGSDVPYAGDIAAYLLKFTVFILNYMVQTIGQLDVPFSFR